MTKSRALTLTGDERTELLARRQLSRRHQLHLRAFIRAFIAFNENDAATSTPAPQIASTESGLSRNSS